MKPIPVILLLVVVNSVAFDTTFSSSDRFLKRHVCDEGVDYLAARDDALLDTVMDEFASLSSAEFAGLRQSVRLSVLVNLYNIATIKLITDNLPVQSIKDIPSAWSRQWIGFGGEKVSLDQIEHEFIRKRFDEPRIHFALVCAAKSCPALGKRAYTPGDLDAQLAQAATVFLTDTKKNTVDKKTLRLSSIFAWFGDDFKKRYGGYQKYVQQVLGLEGRYQVTFQPYDWQLNNAGCVR